MRVTISPKIPVGNRALNLQKNAKIAGGKKRSSNAMYTFDRDIEKTSDKVKAAEDVTSENP